MLQCSTHFHWYRHRLENSIGYKSEVETVLQTGSTNNLTKETDINAISCGRRCRFERSRSWNIQNITVTLEIVLISVSVSKLLVLPSSGLYMMVFSGVVRCRTVDAGGSGLGLHENIAAAAEIILMSFSVGIL